MHGAAAPARPDAVASPCINTCRLDRESGWCLGCLRTGDEIAAWPNADDAQRLTILARLDQRRVALSKNIR
ncbi:DUF1289 domain-containing protein [Sphingomonas sp. CJ99]